MSLTVRSLAAIEILDSRGHPTLEVRAELSDGVTAAAQVPSGASRGRHEALELRDEDPARYQGRGVLKAAANVNSLLNDGMAGLPASDQTAVDRRLREIDGTPNKAWIGANAILGASCALARAVARSRRIPLWSYLAGERKPSVPLPMINILSGGHHAGHRFEIQDFMIIPHGFATYSEALHAAAAVHHSARAVLESRGYLLTGLADEGGWGPALESNAAGLDCLMQAIERAGYVPGVEVSIAIDVAATHFFEHGLYHLRSEQLLLNATELGEMLAEWSRRYPVITLEDPLAEDDWDDWQALSRALGQRLQLVGDDLFTTNPVRLERGIRAGVANAVLVKMNQIGTLSETFEVIDLAARSGYLAVISARSGETEDRFLADLAVASAAGQIKVGSVSRSERMAKYNRLLEIEASGRVPYAGASALRRFIRPV